ncbi:MAG: amylo-alpha-1,6-glucosidase [Verrucomicrobiia bacterium]
MNKLIMEPAPGERRVGFVGDYITFRLKADNAVSRDPGWRAFVRTNLGRAAIRRREIINAYFKKVPLFGASWHDIPMTLEGNEWVAKIPLTEVGYFKAKAYLRDPRGWQHWPEGPDFGINVHPNLCRTGNIIYCAFTRLFSDTKALEKARDENNEEALRSLDKIGYTVIPHSGKLRDLKRELPHIISRLGCKILHLLPVNPVPTTYARFGRFGSPYAALDLTAIDPALVEFDKKTTAVDQFKELAYETHKLGGLLFLDIVVNHTGWGAFLQENFPHWYKRRSDGTFESPGAWGNIWADLVELDQKYPQLWEHFAEAFLTWCRRGVDGFRCDAGYKIPTNVWQYIIARVQEEFPDTVFLLEGLGGAWEATEELLTEGGMQWAYSELFQNYSPTDISGYLDHSIRQSARVGTLIHYSETHDNNRLAVKGRDWSLLRNYICGLTSICGGFGFTCGVEWLATEKIDVHHTAGLRWGSADNIVQELTALNNLLNQHPCFFDGAKLYRLSPSDSFVFALLRISAEEKDAALVLINTDLHSTRELVISLKNSPENRNHFIKGIISDPKNLIGKDIPKIEFQPDENIKFTLQPGSAFCLSDTVMPRGISGDRYRRLRACAAFAFQSMSRLVPPENIGVYNWQHLAAEVYKDPFLFLARITRNIKAISQNNSENFPKEKFYPQVVEWQLTDASRVFVVPRAHWVLIRDASPFRANVKIGENNVYNLASVETSIGQVCAIPPQDILMDGTITIERYAGEPNRVEGKLKFLSQSVEFDTGDIIPSRSSIILLTNRSGAMARICVDLGNIISKYDCVLGANLHPEYPVDRHIFIKRIRLWINADGFLSPLNYENLAGFIPSSPAKWRFIANAGDGRAVEVCLSVWMIEGKNAVVFRVCRSPHRPSIGKELPEDSDVRLTVRFDIEDRNYHTETKYCDAADYHFKSNIREFELTLDNKKYTGFEFTPDKERQLRVFADCGVYHPSPEWSINIPHPLEATRGMIASGDAYSPGWFEIPLYKEKEAYLIAIAETSQPFFIKDWLSTPKEISLSPKLEDRLKTAINAFIVRRGEGKTVIAGYPWFLDWGRDTLICARGLLAAGMIDTVKQIIITFAKYEDRGTLPNAIFGDNTQNRDTSDAPLWFALVCEELAKYETGGKNQSRASIYQVAIDKKRTLLDVLISIAKNYIYGTPNGIKMDPHSGLIFSPSHFTWMDTNHPACTPREGYPIEIQALWIRMLKHLHSIGAEPVAEKWNSLFHRSLQLFNELFWLENEGWYCDVLSCPPNMPAREAIQDKLLRSNSLLPICLDIASGICARRCVESVRKYLLLPAALRSLAPLKADPPLIIRSADGRVLNNPQFPYWGKYEGDEDTCRKPAYHNGTGWVYTFPYFCEALVKAYDFDKEAINAALSYIQSAKLLMDEGCLGHLPELVDGDAPHIQRGCDAQAWSATEFFRVLKYLNSLNGEDRSNI